MIGPGNLAMVSPAKIRVNNKYGLWIVDLPPAGGIYLHLFQFLLSSKNRHRKQLGGKQKINCDCPGSCIKSILCLDNTKNVVHGFL